MKPTAQKIAYTKNMTAGSLPSAATSQSPKKPRASSAQHTTQMRKGSRDMMLFHVGSSRSMNRLWPELGRRAQAATQLCEVEIAQPHKPSSQLGRDDCEEGSNRAQTDRGDHNEIEWCWKEFSNELAGEYCEHGAAE